MKEIIWNEENISRLWNYYSEGDKKTYFGWHSGKSLVRYLRRSGITFDNMKVLDFGCGNGYMYEWIRSMSKNCSYTGADTSPASINYLKENFGDAIETVHIENLPLPIKEEQFDLILATEMVEHVTDDILDMDFSEWTRLLKNGGKLVITTPNNEDMDKSMIYCPNCDCAFHRWQHVRKWTKETLEKCVKSHGLKVVFCKETILYSTNIKPWIYLCSIIKRKLKLANWPNLIMVCEKDS